ncbi:RCC1 domain-containing protein [Paenibacillus sp. FSL R7-0297]|uniref:RCC1-like domain-containing protein n=1 Tax=unclassified Paenibacillus TaxID=185978 RepID=UPI0030F8E1BA
MNVVENVSSIAAGYRHTVLLRPDGAVIAVGDNRYGQCEVSSWPFGQLEDY